MEPKIGRVYVDKETLEFWFIEKIARHGYPGDGLFMTVPEIPTAFFLREVHGDQTEVAPTRELIEVRFRPTEQFYNGP